VFRLVKGTDAMFVPEGRKLREPVNAFIPNKNDIAEAKARDFETPLASVFDTYMTTVSQGQRIRRSDAGMVAFSWSVESLKAISKKNAEYRPLLVRSDPLPWYSGPGRRGHAGMQGLHAEGMSRKIRKAICDELNVQSREITDADIVHMRWVRLLSVIDAVLMVVHLSLCRLGIISHGDPP
jgi:hypothetical protein